MTDHVEPPDPQSAGMDGLGQFQALLSQSVAGIYLICESGRVLFVNAGFAQLSGRTPAEVIGRPFLEFIAEADHAQIVRNFKATLQGQQHAVEVRVRTATGDLRTVIAQGAPTQVEGRPAVIGVAIDVTGRQRAEAALARVNSFLRVITASNKALVRSSTEHQLITRTCDLLVEVGRYRAASVALVHPDSGISLEALAGQCAEALQALEARSVAEDAGGHAAAIRTARTQVCQDWARQAETPPRADAVLASGVRAGVYVPLAGEAGVLGSLGVYTVDREPFQDDELAMLDEVAHDLAYGIAALRDRVERDASTIRLHQSLEETIAVVAAAAEMRDPYTAGHQQRVASIAVAIAGELGMDASRVRALRFAALVHDVGKIRIPAELLTRPGTLTPLERQLIQTHSQVGYDILKNVDFPWPIAEFVLQHHEHMDGSGYPNGIQGSALHLESRILTVADVVEAVSSDRPYREGKGIAAAMAEILDGQGTRYDSDVVAACIRLLETPGFALAAPYHR